MFVTCGSEMPFKGHSSSFFAGRDFKFFHDVYVRLSETMSSVNGSVDDNRELGV